MHACGAVAKELYFLHKHPWISIFSHICGFSLPSTSHCQGKPLALAKFTAFWLSLHSAFFIGLCQPSGVSLHTEFMQLQFILLLLVLFRSQLGAFYTCPNYHCCLSDVAEQLSPRSTFSRMLRILQLPLGRKQRQRWREGRTFIVIVPILCGLAKLKLVLTDLWRALRSGSAGAIVCIPHAKQKFTLRLLRALAGATTIADLPRPTPQVQTGTQNFVINVAQTLK